MICKTFIILSLSFLFYKTQFNCILIFFKDISYQVKYQFIILLYIYLKFFMHFIINDYRSLRVKKNLLKELLVIKINLRTI